MELLIESNSDLVSIVMGLTHHRWRNWDRAEIESAAWYGLWRAARTYRHDSPASFRTWARLKIRGAILDVLKHKRMRTVTMDGCYRLSVHPNVIERIYHDEISRKLHRSLAKLPCKSRRVAQLYLNDFSAGEIALQIGSTVDTVSAHIRASRLQLGRMVKL